MPELSTIKQPEPVTVPVRSAAWRPCGGIGVCARVGNGAVNDEPVPDEQDGERTEGRGDEAGTLVEPIPAEGLADESRQKGTCDSKHGGQNETARIVRSRRKQPRNDAGHEADHDDPDEARHGNLLASNGPYDWQPSAGYSAKGMPLDP